MALALGSNLGDRLAHLRQGVRGLGRSARILAVSAAYESAPVVPAGFEDQRPFLNAAVLATTRLDPRRLLAAAHRVEAAEGRRRSFPNAPRVLDVDLILYGGLVLREPGLTLPHPRWKERSFVLRPLAEVAPDLVDPEAGETVQDLWDARRDRLPPIDWVAAPDSLWRKTP